MRLITAVLAVMASLASIAPAAGNQTPEGLIKVESRQGVAATVSRLRALIEEKGLTYFATVDHAQNAEKAGLSLRPTTLVVFGNPELGTPFMQCRQTVGIDLPQKALVWQDENGQVWIGYNDPRYLAARHGVTGCDEVVAKIGDALDKLVTEAARSQ